MQYIALTDPFESPVRGLDDSLILLPHLPREARSIGSVMYGNDPSSADQHPIIGCKSLPILYQSQKYVKSKLFAYSASLPISPTDEPQSTSEFIYCTFSGSFFMTMK